MPHFRALIDAGVQAAAAKSSYPATSSARYSYTNALHKTLLFIETMRSGVLPHYRVAWCASLIWHCYFCDESFKMGLSGCKGVITLAAVA